VSLINGSGFLNLCVAYRICWISGRFGGGKTALAYRAAYELVKSYGYRYVVSNIKDVWKEPLDKIEILNDMADCVLIMDEGGIYLKYGRDVEEYLKLLRKLNIIILIPSVMPPSNRIRFFKVKRISNLQRIGVPLWVYKWSISDGFESFSEQFYWWRPSEIFGVYDTKAPPIDDGGISQWFSKVEKGNRERQGYTSEAVVTGKEQSAEMDQKADADEIFEAAEIITGGISLYADALSKRRGKY
jgi:hypothetical protein